MMKKTTITTTRNYARSHNWRAEHRPCGWSSRWWVVRGPDRALSHGDLPLDVWGDYVEEKDARETCEALNMANRHPLRGAPQP